MGYGPDKSEDEWKRYWDHIAQANDWFYKNLINIEQYDWLYAMAGDAEWYDVADQLVKKDGKDESKPKDEKCTCPNHSLVQQGCPRLRGEPRCAE